MSDYEKGYRAYLNGEAFYPNMPDAWQRGYLQAEWFYGGKA